MNIQIVFLIHRDPPQSVLHVNFLSENTSRLKRGRELFNELFLCKALICSIICKLILVFYERFLQKSINTSHAKPVYSKCNYIFQLIMRT
jgi:hypothetical protein